jgi:cysteinyl-tRNA synthetase
MQIYNSFTRKKEEFIPITPNTVKMYVCGQTIYDYCHLGHARKAIVFDMVRRWFIASGYMVTFVENITDIDDKIIKRALENNETIASLTDRFTLYMHEDFDRLGIMRPDLQPRATDYVEHMLSIIDSLIQKDYAYLAANGDVYYKVRKFENYGKLSGKTLDELNAGERVDIDQYKEDPLDFVLWKHAKDNEPYWDSKFGKGRPGWHIECSAMAMDLLGTNFDIHGGGQDLQFPHHENEIAQSEAHNCSKYANLWMHNGFLNVNDEKMSKSLGNFFTLRDVLNIYDAEVIRLFMLKTHYRSPLNFNQISLDEAKAGLTRLYTALKQFIEQINLDEPLIDWDSSQAKRFKSAMDDDFNTSLALSIVFEVCSDLNIRGDIRDAKMLLGLANILGLVKHKPLEFLQQGTNLSPDAIEELINQRKQAKLSREFALADKIRNDLLISGIILEDTPNGTTWRKQ